MGRWAKFGVVIGGYVAAIGAGFVAEWLYDVRVSALPYDTSGGMYAGGQMLTSLAVFLVVALAPTLLGLWFLRGHAGFWNVVATAALAFAGAGLIAVLMPLVFHHSTQHLELMLFDLLGLAQLLGVPLWLVAFGLLAILAPTRDARKKLVLATGVELVIGACALVHWFVTRPPF